MKTSKLLLGVISLGLLFAANQSSAKAHTFVLDPNTCKAAKHDKHYSIIDNSAKTCADIKIGDQVTVSGTSSHKDYMGWVVAKPKPRKTGLLVVKISNKSPKANAVSQSSNPSVAPTPVPPAGST